MTKTRTQKEESIKEMQDMMAESKGVIAFGFSRIGVNDLNDFRGDIFEADGQMRVVKRRLLKIALESNDIEFSLKQFIGQTAFVSFEGSLADIASAIYKFGGDTEDMVIFGGYDLEEKAFVEPDYIQQIGNLPSREVLLGQVASVIGGPIRALMYSLNQIAESKNA